MSEYMILVPIVLLLALGAFIALRSGSEALSNPATADGAGIRLVAGNFSALCLRVLGYLAVLIAVQGFVGFPSMFIW